MASLCLRQPLPKVSRFENYKLCACSYKYVGLFNQFTAHKYCSKRKLPISKEKSPSNGKNQKRKRMISLFGMLVPLAENGRFNLVLNRNGLFKTNCILPHLKQEF